MKISLRQLRYLTALASEGHFGRAAATCRISQPALSMQIRDLEAELGTPLIERNRGRLTLTETGQETVRRARAVLVAVDDLVSAARHTARPMAGRMRLGVIPTIAPYLLPRLLPLARDRFGELTIELREGQTELLLDELSSGALDVLLLSLPIADPRITTRTIFRDRFFLLAPRDDPLAGAQGVRQEAIPRDRLLLLEEGHCLRDQALSLCGLSDADSRHPLGATSLATIVQMVAAGYGLTLVPEMAVPVEVRDPGLALIAFAPPEPRREIGLAWRRANPRAADFARLAETLIELEPGRPGMPNPIR